jgi:hypothetical protein
MVVLLCCEPNGEAVDGQRHVEMFSTQQQPLVFDAAIEEFPISAEWFHALIGRFLAGSDVYDTTLAILRTMSVPGVSSNIWNVTARKTGFRSSLSTV